MIVIDSLCPGDVMVDQRDHLIDLRQVILIMHNRGVQRIGRIDLLPEIDVVSDNREFREVVPGRGVDLGRGGQQGKQEGKAEGPKGAAKCFFREKHGENDELKVS